MGEHGLKSELLELLGEDEGPGDAVLGLLEVEKMLGVWLNMLGEVYSSEGLEEGWVVWCLSRTFTGF